MANKKIVTIYRDCATGRFASKRKVKRSPKNTVAEKVCRKRKRSK